MGIPAPIKKACSLLKPLLFSDLFLLLVIVVVMYIQARYNKIENEFLMNSVQSFVFSALNETKMEIATELNRLHAMSISSSNGQKEQQQMRGDHYASLEDLLTMRSGPPPPHPARSSSIKVENSPAAVTAVHFSEEEEGDEDEDVNDEIRCMFRCISSGVQAVHPIRKNHDGSLQITEITEEEKEDDNNTASGGDSTEEGRRQQEQQQEQIMQNEEDDGEDHRGDDKRVVETKGNAKTEVEHEHEHEAPHLAVNMEQLHKMKVPELKKIATDLEIDTKGTKDVLAGRIHDKLAQRHP